MGVNSPIDTIQERSNSDFDIKSASIQFYGNSHNTQSDHWIGLKVYMESSDMLSYVRLESQEGIETRVNRGCMNFVIYILFDLWTSYLARILFLKGCGSLFWESPISTKDEKSDSSIFSMIILDFYYFYYFLLSFWVIITYLDQL
jgi:hypothetical protein